MVAYLFYGLFFLIPLIFYPKTSEVFEFNKIVTIYIFTTLIAGAWLLKMVKEKKIIFRRTILDIPLLIFLGSQIISTIISIDQRTSIFGYYSRFNGGILSTLSYLILYWAFVSNMDRKKALLSIYSILLSGALTAIYGILEHFGGSISCLLVSGKFDDECWVQDVRTRVFATMGQPNWLGALLTSIIPLTWFFTIKKYKKNNTPLIWVGISIIFFLCILFTKSRSSLLALAIAYLIFWTFNFKKHLRIFLTINILLLISIAIFGTPWTPSIKDLTSNQKQTQSQDSSEGGTESGSIRKIVWKGAINAWRSYPIFGTGVETFGYSYWQFRPIEHNNTSEWDYLYNKAHNEYLNFAANTGTLGLVSYLLLIGTIIFVLRKNYPLLAGFTTILITNFFGFSVVAISLLTFIFPAIAISLSIKPKEENKKKVLDNNRKILSIFALACCSYLLFLIGKYWYSDYLYQQSIQKFQSKNYEESILDLQKATSYTPNEAIYHNQMARFLTEVTVELLNSKEASESSKIAPYALQESDIAFDLSPRNMNIRQSRINMYIRLASLDQKYLPLAIALAQKTTELSPTDPKLYLILGKAYANMKNLNEAEKSFQKALTLKPDYEDAIKALEIIKKLQDKEK